MISRSQSNRRLLSLFLYFKEPENWKKGDVGGTDSCVLSEEIAYATKKLEILIQTSGYIKISLLIKTIGTHLSK